MKILNKITKLLIYPTLFIAAISGFISPAYANDTENQILEELVTALNNETDIVYIPYADITNEIYSSTESNIDSLLIEFEADLIIWESQFNQAITIYNQYENYENSEIAEIAQKAKTGSEKGIKAIEAFNKMLESTSESQFEKYANEGDTLLYEAVILHDEAGDIYNDYVGVSSSFTLFYILLCATIISLVATIIFFFKSRKKSDSKYEIKRAEIFREVFIGVVWMTIGLAITSSTLLYVFFYGGYYYIVYGPVLVGGAKLFQGLYSYYSGDRNELDKLKDKSEIGDTSTQEDNTNF